MNANYRGIIILVKSALTGRAIQIPKEFEIDEAFETIKAHHIIPLAYEGAVRCGITKDTDAMKAMFQGYCIGMLKSECQISEARRVFAAFDEAGVDYMPVKGFNIKQLYPKPEFRVMGDVDVLIRKEQYVAIVPLMEKLGFTERAESNHEYIWESEKLLLELHKHLIPSYNKDYYAYFGDGWRFAKNVSGCCFRMSAEDEYIYSFVHFAKHYRDGGIGINHVADLWVYRKAYPGMDMEYVRGELKKLCLLEFYNNIMNLLSVWFEDSQDCEMTDFITDVIFQSGSWGKAENHVLSAEVKNIKAAGSVKGGKIKSLQNTVFPNAEIMAFRYPVLKKFPCLAPAFWPIRWIGALLFRRENIITKQKESRFTTVDRVMEYQQALEYVGLDFRFE